MKIYIELVFVQNFIIDLLLIYLTSKLLKLQTNKLRIFFGALLGAIVASAYSFVSINLYLEILAKLLCGVMIICISFKFDKFIKGLKIFICFCVLTFVLSGLCYAIMQLFRFNNSTTNTQSFVVSLSLCAGILLFITTIKISKYINKHKKISQFCYDASIKIGKKIYKVKCFYDSGNRLIDVKNGLPINIISISLLTKIFGNKFNNNLNKLKNSRFVEYTTVGSCNKKMLVFDVEQFLINIDGKQTEIKNMSFGVIYKKFNDEIGYDILLNNAVFGG